MPKLSKITNHISTLDNDTRFYAITDPNGTPESGFTNWGDILAEAGVDSTSFVLVNGTRPLTSDWDIGNGRSILADKITARDGDGLYLTDSTGENGIFINDGGNVTNMGGHVVHRTAVGAADYNPSILTSDYIIAMTDTAAARAVTISTEDEDSGSSDNPRIMIIKDESGGAAAHNITITLESGGTIDGAANYIMNQNYQSVTLCIDGTNAFII